MIATRQNRRGGLMLAGVLVCAVIGASLYYQTNAPLTAGIAAVLIILALCGQAVPHWWRAGAFYAGALISGFWVFSTYCFNGSWSPRFVSGVGLLWLGYTIVFARLIQRLVHLRWQPRAQRHPRLFFGVSFAALVIVWGAYWLAFYPGLMSYDSFVQWGQASGYAVWSAWHPLLDTFLIALSSHWFNSPAPLLLVQLLGGAAVVSYVLSRLVKRGLPAGLAGLIVAGYALYPINGIFMTTLWKDVPYMILLLLLLYLVSEVIRTQGANLLDWRRACGFGLTVVCTALFRKNGLYVVLILLLALLLIYRTRRLLVIAGVSLAMIFGFNAYTTHVLHAVASPPTEALGIPLQQVAAVYANHGNLTQSQRHYFEQILPASLWQADYRQLTDDNVKSDGHFNGQMINDHPRAFLRQWVKLFWTNKQLYVTAYLDHTAPLWKLNLKDPNLVTLLPDLKVQETRTNYAVQYRRDPQGVTTALKSQYAAYQTAGRQAGQPLISFRQFKARLLRSEQNLANQTKLPALQKRMIAMNARLTAVGQRYLARGAWFVLVALIALAVAILKLSAKQWSLLFLVPFFNYASLFATAPASDFRYAYSLGFSVLLLLMLVLTMQPTKH